MKDERYIFIIRLLRGGILYEEIQKRYRRHFGSSSFDVYFKKAFDDFKDEKREKYLQH